MTTERWKRLSDWHNAWLAADAGERERLRKQLAVNDPALSAEADELAAVSADLSGFLETPAFVLAAPELAKDEPLLAAVARTERASTTARTFIYWPCVARPNTSSSALRPRASARRTF